MILVVEDDALIRESLVELLESAGFAVQAVQNGREALGAVDRQKFSVILLDLMMPIMSGREFLAEIRSRGDIVPVVVVTGEGDSEAELSAFGSQAYLVKPFEPEELFSTIVRLVT